MKDYHINLFWSEEDGCWVADIPDLKRCSAIGATPAQAVQEIEIAKKVWLAAARKHRRPIPEPRYRPAIYQVAR